MKLIKDFHLKLKSIRVRIFLGGDGEKRKTKNQSSRNLGRNLSWMVPLSHGYHSIVEDKGSLGRVSMGSEIDSVVVQREQIEDHEVWFFGVFDAEVADGVTKYMQTNLFDNRKHKESLMRRSKEAMRKAHMYAKTKIQEKNKAEETCKMGSASAIVINGERLIIASMGEYSAVICKEGEARQIHRKHHQGATRRHWSHKFIPGVLTRQRGRRINGPSANADGGNGSNQTSEQLHVGSERIHSETEFVILANAGIWEVMQHQEAISLIRHLEDPQEAAECLANEALSRMSRRNISCLIIRFESFD